jgi:ABC-type oligopeptide transport system substrate-binding subunit
VTAADFEYAWKRRLDPINPVSVTSFLYDVKGARAFHQGEVSDPDHLGVQALDEVTLVVELEQPANYFLSLLTSVCLPVPRHVVERHGEAWTEVGNLVTNGPFKLEALQRGESIVMSRNPEYHGRFTGNVQRVEYSGIADPSARLEMYETDSLDIAGLPENTSQPLGWLPGSWGST